MMIMDLPKDLVMEILCRVPLKSMREVGKTCKKLNTLSKSESFAKLHLAKGAAPREGEEYLKAVILDHDLRLMSVTVDDGDIKAKLTSSLNQQVKVSQVFHCDGLLLCILKDNSKIVVWNPYWGQTRWIQPRYTQTKIDGFDRYRYALGYANDKNTCRPSHKLLRLFYQFSFQSRNVYRKDRFQWYEIYDFDTDQWTTLDVPLDLFITLNQRGVSVKGNTYFCAKKTRTFEDHLICFDYKREEFGPLMRFPLTSHPFSDRVTLSCVREEKLAALLIQNPLENPSEFEIWITTKIEPEEVLWSKLLTLNMVPEVRFLTQGFFIDEEKKVVMGFDDDMGTQYILSIVGEAGYIKRLELGERVRGKEWFINRNYNRRELCSYVPSIVQIKQPNKGTRKQQSYSELIRYKEKMSSLEPHGSS